MKVGIIGTGDIGGTLARKLSAARHHLRVANSRGLEGVRAFANEIGATAVDTRGAVKDVDLNCHIDPVPSGSRASEGLVRHSLAGCSGHRHR